MIKIAYCSKKEFIRRTQKHKIICIGAGQGFNGFMDGFHLEEQLLYVADNKKNGVCLQTEGGKTVPVLSVEEIVGAVKDCIPVITTLKYADEIIAQLDGIAELDGVTFYIPELFYISQEGGAKPDRAGRQRIPRIIHYCWFGKGKMPETFVRNMETWRKYCPDYQIIRWDESNYNVNTNKYMSQAYEAGVWGFVPDYARLDIVHTYGGIYLDTDVELIRPLDDLLIYPFYCGYENEQYINLGLGFGAEKGNKILKEMMNHYLQLEFVNPDGSLNRTASPVYQTQTFEKFGLKRNGMTQITDDFAVLSTEYLSPIDVNGFGKVTENTFSIHKYAGTWLDDEQQEYKKICHSKNRFIMAHME